MASMAGFRDQGCGWACGCHLGASISTRRRAARNRSGGFWPRAVSRRPRAFSTPAASAAGAAVPRGCRPGGFCAINTCGTAPKHRPQLPVQQHREEWHWAPAMALRGVDERDSTRRASSKACSGALRHVSRRLRRPIDVPIQPSALPMLPSGLRPGRRAEADALLVLSGQLHHGSSSQQGAAVPGLVESAPESGGWMPSLPTLPLLQ
ncbi:uncharacterized protein BDZ99DRAFT_86396 [Mytilinidion resinicola]|uniref:Uncharacterized protein n=1 Tax=Mytilinidion resinicola TaxID=574789 RepID=A0A6A6YDD8_9PEZI|nr:uncharacterized protein BDZ99DRAFT_86396 [Mytilinidion resinicola]KAF2806841.1 hypothetical protein BDZ99DRAFT_86396 [Mytilinidion resinicola]